MEKYNNGKVIDVPKDKVEQELAIRQWSEGNEHLQNAISSCINNGIETFASCKGHGFTDTPYLSVRVTAENIEKIINIINNLSDKNKISISLSFDEIKQGSILSIYTKMSNKNDIFDLIATSAESPLELKNANEITQEILKLHQVLRVYGAKNDRMTTIIDLNNHRLNREIRLVHGMGSYDYLLDTILEESTFRTINKTRAYTFKESKSRKESKLKTFNKDLISAFRDGKCKMVEDDEFASKIEIILQDNATKKRQDFSERLQGFTNTTGERIPRNINTEEQSQNIEKENEK